MTTATFIVVMFKVACKWEICIYDWTNAPTPDTLITEGVTDDWHHFEWTAIQGSKQRHLILGNTARAGVSRGGFSVRTAAVVWQDMLKSSGRRMENSLSFIPPRPPVYTASMLYCTRHAVLQQPVRILRLKMFYTHSSPHSVSSSCHTKSRAVDAVKKSNSEHFNPKAKQPYQSNLTCWPTHSRSCPRCAWDKWSYTSFCLPAQTITSLWP